MPAEREAAGRSCCFRVDMQTHEDMQPHDVCHPGAGLPVRACCVRVGTRRTYAAVSTRMLYPVTSIAVCMGMLTLRRQGPIDPAQTHNVARY